MKNAKTIGSAMGVVSGIAYGFYGIFSSMLLKAGVKELSIIAIPPLVLVVYFGIRILFKPRALKSIPGKIYLLLIVQGGLIATAMNFCYQKAYASGMPVGVVSIVAFCNVIVVMVLSRFLLKYQFTKQKIIAVLIAIFGVSLVIGIFGETVSGGYTAQGLLWTLLIPLFYGTNVVLNTYALMHGCDSDGVMLIAQGASLVVVLVFMVTPAALFQDLTVHLSGEEAWIGFLGFIIIPNMITYAAMQESLKRIDPTIYQIMMSLDPVVALILGVLVMKQTVTGMQLLGVLIVLAAVVFITIIDGHTNTETID